MVKNLPAKQEIQIPSLGQEDLLEKAMATHFPVFLTGQRSLVGYSPRGHKELDMTEQLDFTLLLLYLLSTVLSQHHLLGFERAQLEFHHLH